MHIRPAQPWDLPTLAAMDRWIDLAVLAHKIENGQVFAAVDDGQLIGWLRYGLFWDAIPFMNMLRLLEPYRRKGFGTQLVRYWEREMMRQGHKMVLTSTAQTEYAQHFYVKLGYRAVGGFLLPNEPQELILAKEL